MVRSDSKIDEDWEKKLKEREIKELEKERNGDKEEKINGTGEKGSVVSVCFFFLRKSYGVTVVYF